MGDPRVVPKWLKSLPLAPEYRPTDTEFADPIAFISRIEQEASAFGICKVIPPLPKPSKRFVFANLTRSLSSSPDVSPDSASKDAASAAVFTTRQQELGSKKPCGVSVHKQVWQSGEFYTLEQFEAKSKSFAKTQLGSSFKDATSLEVETAFWKVAAEKPIYIEYANDVPGSGFAVPEDTQGYHYRRRRGKKARFRYGRRSMDGSVTSLPHTDAAQNVHRPESSELKKDMEGTAGWKLSNCPWNLQVIARSPGSLTRFMPDEVPGVTSPMVYIAMLFSWFAWHVEDHELHSLNFLHTGAPKTWYAVPGDYATAVEEVVHKHGYGDNLDKLAAYMVLGEKRTLISPEILVASGIPCCRLVQNPGEFVVTFPRAYHVGFSHGFNCGEAANFATSKWLQFAKEAASRRAAMNYLPMLSHQQLLYMLAMSFISRVPRALLPGARSSRLRDRMKEERELHVKKAFLQDLIHELKLLRLLMQKKTSSYAVLWDSDLLPPAINSTASSQQLGPISSEPEPSKNKDRVGGSSCVEGDGKLVSELEKKPGQDSIYHAGLYSEDNVDSACIDDGDLPCGLDADSGVLPCVACGILGYPFMCIIQPSDRASQNLFSASNKKTYKRFLNVKETDARKADVPGDITTVEVYSGVCGIQTAIYPNQGKNSAKQEIANYHGDIASALDSSLVYSDTHRFDIFSSEHQPVIYDDHGESGNQLTIDRDDSGRDISTEKVLSHGLRNFDKTVENLNETTGKPVKGEKINRKSEIGERIPCALQKNNANLDGNWNIYNPYLRPRLFCLRHALEVEELLLCDGGSRILIICNSDYLKIRGQAMSIDEEVGVQLNSQDIPLINANKEELDLINISIDDDECKELDEDWTMKLGVNLRHFVKGRKQSSQKQELFTLALEGLFSDTFYNRISPSLRWKGKRSRTPYRMMTGNESKQLFRIESHIRKNNWRTTDTIYKSPEEPCFTEICEGEPSDVRPGKCQKHLISNQDQVLHKRSHAVPCENVVDTEKQGASSFIPRSNSEFLKSECLADDQRRDSPSPEKMSTEISESLIPEILPASASCIDGNYLLSEEVSEKDSVEVDDLQLQNPCSTPLEDLECSSKLPCMESNSGHKFDDPDVSDDHGAVAAYTLEAQCDNILVDKAGFATEAGESFLTGCADPTVIGNSKLLERILVKNSPESGACSDEIRKSCTRIVVFDGAISDFKLNKSGLATGTRDKVHLKSESLDATIVDNPKMLQSIMIHNPENDTHMEDVIERCTGMTASDSVGNAADQEATALKEISSERCTVDSLECQMNASTSLGGSSIPYEAMQTITVAKSGDSVARPPTYLYVYARRKKLTENRDRSVMHSGTEKSLVTSKNTGIDVQESPARNLAAITGCSDACGPASSDEGYDCSNDGISTAKKRKRFKRKREADQLSTAQYSGSSFIRGPCEGLRARTGRIKYEEPKIMDLKITAGDARKKRKVTAVRRKRNAELAFQCGLEGCKLRFQTEEELDLHKCNRCTYEGCGKRFRNHKHTMRHRRVHDNNRPFKCPWKGCFKSFNWEWARTEHLRLHTGERPYKCSDPECGRTFRFISDFSRHRRKTGHGADG